MNNDTTTTTENKPSVRAVLLGQFDAGTKRGEIIAALTAARDASTNGIRGGFDAAIAFLSEMQPMARSAARDAVVAFLATLPPSPVDVEVAPEAIEESGPAPLPLVESAEPIGVQLDGARAVVDAAANAPDLAPIETTIEAVAPPPRATESQGEPSEASDDRADKARAVALAEAPLNVANVYSQCVWLRVRFRRLGVTRDASADVTVEASDGTNAAASTKTSKRILSKCAEWKAIEASDAAFRLRVRAMAVPSKLDGIYPITTSAMERVESMVAEYEPYRAELVRALVNVFPEAIEADKLPPPVGLGALWNPEDYPAPSQVASYYRDAYTWVDMSNSTRLSTAMAARNAKAIQQEEREAFAEVRAALRLQVSNTVDEMIGLLRPDATGNRKGFRDARVDKLREWCAMFASRNVTDDSALSATVERIKGVLDGVTDVSALVKSDPWRDEIAAKLDVARSELRTLGVADAPARKFRKRGAKSPAPAAE